MLLFYWNHLNYPSFYRLTKNLELHTHELPDIIPFGRSVTSTVSLCSSQNLFLYTDMFTMEVLLILGLCSVFPHLEMGMESTDNQSLAVRKTVMGALS